jgi:hypothetical protein
MHDLRFALRSLARSPGFAVVAVVIVALGIGAATAMFSAVNALVLRPVALPEPERLAVVYETNLARNIPRFTVSYPNYSDWCVRSQSWEALAAVAWRSMNLTGAVNPSSFMSGRCRRISWPRLGSRRHWAAALSTGRTAPDTITWQSSVARSGNAALVAGLT